MTDAVETMAYRGETPWHGKGADAPEPVDGETPEEFKARWMSAAGIDWKVLKRAVAFRKTGKGGSTQTIPNKFALVRDRDDQYLSMCGTGYKPMQNEQGVDFLMRFVAAGHMTLETMGSLMDGQYVWGLARTEDNFKLAGNDRVNSFLLVMLPHVAGKAVIFQHTAVRVVCWNTLNAALGAGLRGREGAFRMSHVHEWSDDMALRAEEALGLTREHLAIFREAAEALQAKRVTPEWTQGYLEQVIVANPYRPKLVAADGTEVSSTVKRVSPLLTKMQLAVTGSPGADLPSAAGTAWGAFNAVTYVIDHESGSTQDKRLRDAWLGGRGEWKQRALRLAVDLAA